MKPASRAWLPAAALVALAAVAYANSFGAGFVMDNSAIILADPRLRAVNWTNIQLIFGRDYWWPNYPSELYRPLTTLSYWMNFSLFGGGVSPFGYHAVNLLLHATNVLLLWRVAARVGVAAGAAWVAAAIFAVHPLGVEAVTNVVGRADLLITGGILLTALAWLRAEAATERRETWQWRGVAMAASLLAVFAKENGVMAVAGVALLVVRAQGWRQAPGYFLRRALVVGAPAVLATLTVRIAMAQYAPLTDAGFTANPIGYGTAWSAFMTAVTVLGRYARLLVWPGTLSCDYSYPQIRLVGEPGGPDVEAWLALAGFVVAGVVLWRRRAASPLAVGGIVWGAVMLAPTSNLFVHIGTIMAERFLYLPLTGLAVAGAIGLAALTRKIATGPAIARIVPAVVLAAFAARTLVRNTDWHDERSLWEAGVAAAPQSFKTHKGLAVALYHGGVNEVEVDAALARVEIGLRLLDSPPLPPERQENSSWGDGGEFYRRKGELALARGDRATADRALARSIELLDRALATDRWVAAEVHRRLLAKGWQEADIPEHGNPRILTQRAFTLLVLDRLDEASEAVTLLQRVDPLNADARLMRGQIATARGDPDAAAAQYLAVTLLTPAEETAWQLLTAVYAQIGLGNALGTAPAGNRVLDPTFPRARRQLDAAFRDIVLVARAAKRRAVADAWQQRAIRDFGCAPELFAP